MIYLTVWIPIRTGSEVQIIRYPDIVVIRWWISGSGPDPDHIGTHILRCIL